MRWRRWLPRARQAGGRGLTALLLATPFASVLGPALGGHDYPVFGTTLRVRAWLCGAFAAAWLAAHLLKRGERRMAPPLARAALVLVIALAQAWVMARRANRFYTAEVLVESGAVLLALHVAGQLLRRVGGVGRHAPVANDVEIGAAVLIFGFWTAAGVGWRDLAGIPLLLAGGCLVFVVVMRLGALGLVRVRHHRRRRQWPVAVLLLIPAAIAGAQRAPATTGARADCDDVGGAPLAATRVTPLPSVPPSGVTTGDSLHLVLNIPAFRLDLFRDDVRLRSFAVAAGMPRFATPLGEFEIARIVWNPWWYPPESPWARRERVTPPGPENPMGRVKLLMRGPYYLHGTPWESSIGQAASHGCIRMRDADAIALARLLQRATGAAISEGAVDSLTSVARTTREVELPRAVPVRIEYTLVEVRDDSLLVHADVYGRAAGPMRALVLGALAGAGVDTASLNRAAMDSVLSRARRERVRVPLRVLLPPKPDTTFTPERSHDRSF